MPIYEFVCHECGESFEELVFSASAVSKVNCPKCSSSEVVKKMSTFASKISGTGSRLGGSTSSAASCTTSA